MLDFGWEVDFVESVMVTLVSIAPMVGLVGWACRKH